MDLDLDLDALDAYAAADARARILRAHWHAKDCPTTINTGGTIRAHPLLAQVERAELLADRLRRACRSGHDPVNPPARSRRDPALLGPVSTTGAPSGQHRPRPVETIR
jgi:hypothetical protein